MVLDLVEQADILIEGFRPGVTERLGLGPDVCHARNPRLVYGRMTGWGQDGPLAHSAGHDINYISVAGALDTIGRAGGPPQIPLNLLGDFGGGSLYLVAGVLAALTHARATGQGQVVDAAITDGVAHLMAMPLMLQQSGSWSNERGTNLLDSGAPFYDVYETSDGRWMSVGGLEPQFYAAMQDLLAVDLPDRNDFARWPALRATLGEVFATKTQAEWAEVFEGTDACVGARRALGRGGPAPAQRRPRDLPRARRTGAASASTAVLGHPGRPDHSSGQARRQHPRSTDRLGSRRRRLPPHRRHRRPKRLRAHHEAHPLRG